MQNRTTAIILTVVTAVLCGCLGLLACIFGGLGVAQVPFTTTSSSGYSSQAPMPIWAGIGLLCLPVIFVAVPVVVGVLTLRKKKPADVGPIPPAAPPMPPQEPLPPAS